MSGISAATVITGLSAFNAALAGVSALRSSRGGRSATPAPPQQVAERADPNAARDVAERTARNAAGTAAGRASTVITSPRGLTAPAQRANRTILGG